MAYTINHYNGTLLTTVADGTVDTSTDLTLIGKNYAGYGQAQNDNFVWLLENFADTRQPPNPIPGQIWYDSGHRKLKFYDGTTFRTTGGAEIGSTQPGGLTQGDFWFNTATNQLFAYTGSEFTLIGPQGVAGAGLTEMVSTTVTDSNGNSHAIIKAVDNGQVIFTISADAQFTLGTLNTIAGFDIIRQGITLAYTENSTGGVTSAAHRFWGTSTNSEKLDGHAATDFVLSASPEFTQTVNFPDTGLTVGSPNRLQIFNEPNTRIPTIYNPTTDRIVFKTTVNNAAVSPLQLFGLNVIPGANAISNLGSITNQWATVYATNFNGTATNANALNLGGNYVTATTAATLSTIVARDANADIFCNVMHGTATSANYADLAEKYLADQEYEVGTVMAIGGTAEVTAAKFGDVAIGVISDKPAYLMNSELAGGVAVALKGRVPVKVIGPVKKGDALMPSGSGYARTIVDADTPRVFAVALADDDGTDVRLVECLVL